VHLASRGHPLIADAVYGGALALGMQRQALHAARLKLQHPVLGAPLSFHAEAPADFGAAWQQITECA
jgi:23S rRNA pseudouridine1911/1915/1917 synthase